MYHFQISRNWPEKMLTRQHLLCCHGALTTTAAFTDYLQTPATAVLSKASLDNLIHPDRIHRLDSWANDFLPEERDKVDAFLVARKEFIAARKVLGDLTRHVKRKERVDYLSKQERRKIDAFLEMKERFAAVEEKLQFQLREAIARKALRSGGERFIKRGNLPRNAWAMFVKINLCYRTLTYTERIHAYKRIVEHWRSSVTALQRDDYRVMAEMHRACHLGYAFDGFMKACFDERGHLALDDYDGRRDAWKKYSAEYTTLSKNQMEAFEESGKKFAIERQKHTNLKKKERKEKVKLSDEAKKECA